MCGPFLHDHIFSLHGGIQLIDTKYHHHETIGDAHWTGKLVLDRSYTQRSEENAYPEQNLKIHSGILKIHSTNGQHCKLHFINL
jgi:hypothetical protein